MRDFANMLEKQITVYQKSETNKCSSNQIQALAEIQVR